MKNTGERKVYYSILPPFWQWTMVILLMVALVGLIAASFKVYTTPPIPPITYEEMVRDSIVDRRLESFELGQRDIKHSIDTMKVIMRHNSQRLDEIER